MSELLFWSETYWEDGVIFTTSCETTQVCLQNVGAYVQEPGIIFPSSVIL
jgi:hypothetical protein